MNVKEIFSVNNNWIRIGAESFPKNQIYCITKYQVSGYEDGEKIEKHIVKITFYGGKYTNYRNIYCVSEDEAENVVKVITATATDPFVTIPK